MRSRKGIDPETDTMQGVLQYHGPEIRYLAYLYPTQDNVGMSIRLEDPFLVKRSDIQPLLDYIQEKGYRIIDDLTSWLIACTVEDGKNYYYFDTRISVDKTGTM